MAISAKMAEKAPFEMWLASYTQDEIAALVECTRDVIRGVKEVKYGESGNIAEFPKAVQVSSNHAPDFDPPLYNVWKFQERSSGSKHPGNSESTILDNLLYLYTHPEENLHLYLCSSP